MDLPVFQMKESPSPGIKCDREHTEANIYMTITFLELLRSEVPVCLVNQENLSCLYFDCRYSIFTKV